MEQPWAPGVPHVPDLRGPSITIIYHHVFNIIPSYRYKYVKVATEYILLLYNRN